MMLYEPLSLDLRGHTALITGASGELGRVMARNLARCGAGVIIHYNSSAAKAESLASELSALGAKVFVVQADVTSIDSVMAMRDRIGREFVLPDIVVSNAVVQYVWHTVLDQDLGDYLSQFDSCVMQAVHLAKAFIPYMQEQKWGRFIAINTESAMQAFPGQSAYAAAKRGLDGIVRTLAKEVGAQGITVNQVAPGWTVSEKDREAGTQRNEGYDAKVPLGRRGTDQEIAQAVAFLASDLASFITGIYLPVSGGNVIPGI